MYQSLAAWIQQTFSQNDPITDQNEISPEEIAQLMAIQRLREPDMAWKRQNPADTSFDVDNNTAQVTLGMRDLSGARTNYGRGHAYWLHPEHFAVLVDDVEIEEHNYTFYPVSCDLEFNYVVATDAVVEIRGHLLNEKLLMKKVAQQWLLKIGMVVDVTNAQFERVFNRFSRIMHQLYGTGLLRRT
jgi:hypothetical protein